MYQFRIKQQESGGYRFELDDIKMLVDEYSIQQDKHVFTHPEKIIAYFNIGDSIYGVSNELWNYATAEDFYESIRQQYLMLAGNGRDALLA